MTSTDTPQVETKTMPSIIQVVEGSEETTVIPVNRNDPFLDITHKRFELSSNAMDQCHIVKNN